MPLIFILPTTSPFSRCNKTLSPVAVSIKPLSTLGVDIPNVYVLVIGPLCPSAPGAATLVNAYEKSALSVTPKCVSSTVRVEAPSSSLY